MKLDISSKDKFVNNFISPLSRVTDSAVLKVVDKQITSIVATSDNTIIISSKYADENIKADKILNIPDLKKLHRVLSCIESESFSLDIAQNYIGYSSDSIRFKYHLYDEGIINTPKINVDKVSSLVFDGEFAISYSTVAQLLKGSTISTESNKLYLSVKDQAVFGELTDKTRSNVDSYGIRIAQNYTGTQFAVPIPLNFEIFRIISSMKFKEVNAKIITKMGVVTLDLDLESSHFKFLISALAN
ncbi:hypothetical protein EBR43_10880 [bacterium]|nr:hypothetical protein [bacterium]